jgi:excisionase family DNA binding protein
MEATLTDRLAVVTRTIPNKPRLNMAEVCAALGCSDNHVRHLIEEGSLIAIDVSCQGCRPNWRIERESVVQFLKGRVS